MTTVKVEAEIDSMGILRLNVPIGLPPGHAEVVVVVQSDTGKINEAEPPVKLAARSGLFGAASSEIDIDSALGEMNKAWKSKLAGLP